jgi:hypothetical protein
MTETKKSDKLFCVILIGIALCAMVLVHVVMANPAIKNMFWGDLR